MNNKDGGVIVGMNKNKGSQLIRFNFACDQQHDGYSDIDIRSYSCDQRMLAIVHPHL